MNTDTTRATPGVADTANTAASPDLDAGASVLTLAEAQAFRLIECAVALDKARQTGASLTPDMARALNANLEVWVAVRTFAERPDCPFDDSTQRNLVSLSRFVADRIFRAASTLTEQTLDTLININLHISEGLLEGQKKSSP